MNVSRISSNRTLSSNQSQRLNYKESKLSDNKITNNQPRPQMDYISTQNFNENLVNKTYIKSKVAIALAAALSVVTPAAVEATKMQSNFSINNPKTIFDDSTNSNQVLIQYKGTTESQFGNAATLIKRTPYMKIYNINLMSVDTSGEQSPVERILIGEMKGGSRYRIDFEPQVLVNPKTNVPYRLYATDYRGDSLGDLRDEYACWDINGYKYKQSTLINQKTKTGCYWLTTISPTGNKTEQFLFIDMNKNEITSVSNDKYRERFNAMLDLGFYNDLMDIQ